MKHYFNKLIILYFALAFLLASLTSCDQQTKRPQPAAVVAVVAVVGCEAAASAG